MLLFNSIHGVEISDIVIIIIFVFRPDNFGSLKPSLKVFQETSKGFVGNFPNQTVF